MKPGWKKGIKMQTIYQKCIQNSIRKTQREEILKTDVRSRLQNNDKIDTKQKGWQGVKWIQPAQYKDHAFVILLLSFHVECEVSGLH